MSIIGTIEPSIPLDTTFPACLGSYQQADTKSQEQLDVKEIVAARPRLYRARKDSGFSETSRRPIYRLPSDNGSLTFLELQKNVDESGRPKDLATRYSHITAQNKSKPSVKSNRDLCRRSKRKDDIKPNQPTTQHQLESTESIDILSTPSRSSRQSISVEPCTPAEHCILVYAKSISTAETLELSGYSASSGEISRSSSMLRLADVPDGETIERSIPSAMASTVNLEAHHFSSLHVATNIDWTSPHTRQRIYERHDRDQQTIRRWIRRIVPRKLQEERVDFYDGNSDTGSIRRYRLDVDEPSLQDISSDKTRTIRHVLSCFSSLRNTSRMRS